MKALIFGISGQDGHYLNELLLRSKVKVIGVSRSGGKWVKGNVANTTFVDSLIKRYVPDYIFHLASASTTKHVALFENHKAICTGSLNILESVRKYCPKCRVFLSGSALQFENVGLPINEKTPFRANSPYAVARIQSVYAGRYYKDTFNLKVYVGYFFNHESPFRTENHINKEIVEAVKKIARGKKRKLELGNVNVKKEFNFAGDIVEAVWLLVNQDAVFEAVIGSGKVYSIKNWVDYCFKKSGKNWKDYVSIKKKYVSEYKILISNPKIIKSLGWKPKVDFYELADMMMEDRL